MRTRARYVVSLAACATLLVTAAAAGGDGPAGAVPPRQPAGAPSHAYRANDYARGHADSILPPGENGLVTAAQLAQFEATGKRPPNSADQLGKYARLLRVNNTRDVAKWTASTASAAAKQAMPVYDDIQFRAIGVIGQPAIDWQNRPTFQHVIEFPAHRPASARQEGANPRMDIRFAGL